MDEFMEQLNALCDAKASNTTDSINRQDAINAVGVNTWAGFRLGKLPSAERKTGKWNWISFNIECSECGCMPCFDSTEPLYNFCPNCGADMRGEQNGFDKQTGCD